MMMMTYTNKKCQKICIGQVDTTAETNGRRLNLASFERKIILPNENISSSIHIIKTLPTVYIVVLSIRYKEIL